MTITNVIAGMQIVDSFRPDDKSPYHVRAEHDNIYIGSLDWPIPETEQMKLEDLGWEKDEDADGYRAMV
jgi:hypothetical protein